MYGKFNSLEAIGSKVLGDYFLEDKDRFVTFLNLINVPKDVDLTSILKGGDIDPKVAGVLTAIGLRGSSERFTKALLVATKPFEEVFSEEELKSLHDEVMQGEVTIEQFNSSFNTTTNQRLKFYAGVVRALSIDLLPFTANDKGSVISDLRNKEIYFNTKGTLIEDNHYLIVEGSDWDLTLPEQKNRAYRSLVEDSKGTTVALQNHLKILQEKYPKAFETLVKTVEMRSGGEAKDIVLEILKGESHKSFYTLFDLGSKRVAELPFTATVKHKKDVEDNYYMTLEFSKQESEIIRHLIEDAGIVNNTELYLNELRDLAKAKAISMLAVDKNPNIFCDESTYYSIDIRFYVKEYLDKDGAIQTNKTFSPYNTFCL